MPVLFSEYFLELRWVFIHFNHAFFHLNYKYNPVSMLLSMIYKCYFQWLQNISLHGYIIIDITIQAFEHLVFPHFPITINNTFGISSYFL